MTTRLDGTACKYLRIVDWQPTPKRDGLLNCAEALLDIRLKGLRMIGNRDALCLCEASSGKDTPQYLSSSLMLFSWLLPPNPKIASP